MSITVSDILLSVAYRRGEDSLPNDANESQRRLLYVAEAYRKVCQANLYWFLEKFGAMSSVTDKNRYTLPDDFRDFMEVRVDNIIRIPVANFQAHNDYNYPASQISYANYYNDRNYYLDNNEIVFIPAISSTPSSFSVTIASTGTLATVTSATEHGMQTDDYVTISGSAVALYNSQFRVTVIDGLNFTVNLASSFTGSGSGSGVYNNIRYKYHFHPAKITSLTDTVYIPDAYSDILVAYVCGRLFQLEGEKGDAADSFAEFEEIKKELNKENLRRGIFNANINSNFIK